MPGKARGQHPDPAHGEPGPGEAGTDRVRVVPRRDGAEPASGEEHELTLALSVERADPQAGAWTRSTAIAVLVLTLWGALGARRGRVAVTISIPFRAPGPRHKAAVHDRRDGRAVTTFPGGVTPMVVFAVVLVGAEVLALTFVGSKVWAGIYQTPPDPNSLQIDVQSEQFAFYFRYPGPDGKFGATHPELINEASENYFGLDPKKELTPTP